MNSSSSRGPMTRLRSGSGPLTSWASDAVALMALSLSEKRSDHDIVAQITGRDQHPDGAAQPKKTSASAYSSGVTSLSSPVPSISGTRTIRVPRSAIIVP